MQEGIFTGIGQSGIHHFHYGMHLFQGMYNILPGFVHVPGKPANQHNDSFRQAVIVSKKESRVVVSVASSIEEKLTATCNPTHMELFNESHMHAGPASESHFKLVLVTDQFAGMTAVKRHQTVYRILRDELAGPVHALALHLYSPEEWASRSGVPASPDCAGKN
jgi:BolA protein